MLCLFGNLLRLASSVIFSALLVVRLTSIGGSRLLSRGEGTGDISDNPVGEDESGRGTPTVPLEGAGGSGFTIWESAGGSN